MSPLTIIIRCSGGGLAEVLKTSTPPLSASILKSLFERRSLKQPTLNLRIQSISLRSTEIRTAAFIFFLRRDRKEESNCRLNGRLRFEIGGAVWIGEKLAAIMREELEGESVEK